MMASSCRMSRKSNVKIFLGRHRKKIEKRESTTVLYRAQTKVLQRYTEPPQVLQSTTEHYRVLHGTTKYYTVLQGTTKDDKVLQSTTQFKQKTSTNDDLIAYGFLLGFFIKMLGKNTFMRFPPRAFVSLAS